MVNALTSYVGLDYLIPSEYRIKPYRNFYGILDVNNSFLKNSRGNLLLFKTKRSAQLFIDTELR